MYVYVYMYIYTYMCVCAYIQASISLVPHQVICLVTYLLVSIICAWLWFYSNKLGPYMYV